MKAKDTFRVVSAKRVSHTMDDTKSQGDMRN